MALTAKGRKALTRLGMLVVIAGGLLGVRYLAVSGYGARIMEAIVPDRVEFSALTEYSNPDVAMLPLPSTQPANMAGRPQVRLELAAWNAQIGCIGAVGGTAPTQGSLMERAGIDLRIARNDDYDVLRANLAKFAQQLHAGQANPSGGAHFIAIMGDNAAAWLQELNPMLERSFGPEFRAEVVGSCGYSMGEDKLMGPQAWRDNPQAIRGAVLTGVLRDGGWNLVQRYLGDNNIPNNPDEKTYDPDAVNWISVDDYIDAAQKYVAGYCEDRPVVSAGRRTGETRRVCIDGVVTWTPGDVIVAEQRGGLVSVISTREYSGQMPNVIIGIRRWNEQNRATVEGMLDAFFTAGDQVKGHSQWLRFAAEASHRVYNEPNTSPEYWETYYRGVTRRDKQGLQVELGGSRANNLADNLLLFGLAEGTTPQTARYRAAYTIFGDIAKAQYPHLVSSYPAYDQVVNTSFLQALASRGTGAAQVATVETYENRDVSRVVGRRGYAIQFETGRASFTPAAERELSELFNALSINSLSVQIHGHTDNVGDPQMNMQLSEDRAMAVKDWLERRSASTFPPGRIRVFAHGSTQPLASNREAEGRQQNRRVEVVIGN
jgi:OmpA-OmpF porin, OOP family